MKIKSKIVLFVCAFALIFSVVSVSCFAYVVSLDVGSSYSFIRYPLVTDSFGNDFDFDESGGIALSIDGVLFTSFLVGDGIITIGSDSSTYYFSGTSWNFAQDGVVSSVDPPSFILVSLDDNTSFEFIDWLKGNVVLNESSPSFYENLFSSISEGVFGPGAALTPEQVMTLTLISTILSYAFILLPLLLVIGFVLRCFRL